MGVLVERFFCERCEGSWSLWPHLVKRKLCRMKDATVMVIWHWRLMFIVPVANKVVMTMLSPLEEYRSTQYWISHPSATCTVLYCTLYIVGNTQLNSLPWEENLSFFLWFQDKAGNELTSSVLGSWTGDHSNAFYIWLGCPKKRLLS